MTTTDYIYNVFSTTMSLLNLLATSRISLDLLIDYDHDGSKYDRYNHNLTPSVKYR